MSARNILTLDTPMGTGLIRILYCIALVLIGLGTLLGVVGGIRTMMRPERPPIVAAAPAPMSPAAQMPASPKTAAIPNRPDFGPRRFHRGPRFGMRGRPLMMGGMMLPPAAAGSLQILFVLLRGLVVLMVVRILAEMGTAILTMNSKPTQK